MKAEEKLARELIPYIAGCRWDQASSKERIRAEDTAIYVLRRERAAVRRARGRTLGYTAIQPEEQGGNFGVVRPMPRDHRAVTIQENIGWRVARVVAVPRKGGRK